MFTLLNHPLFGRLFAAQIVALLGTGLLTVALGLLAYDLAGPRAAAVLGTAYAIKMLAYVILSPVAAAVFARTDRKTLLVSADLVRIAVAFSLPFLSEIWQIYLAIFVLQSASATFSPAFQATIPDILPDEAEYTQALSLSRMAYDVESLISPIIAGLLLTVLPFHWLFVGTAFGFIASAILIVRLSLPNTKARQRPFLQRLTSGTRIYLATPRLRGLLFLVLAAAAISGFVITNTVSLVRDQYEGSEGDVAIALAAFGAGSMLAAFAMPGLLRHLSDRRIMIGSACGLIVVMLIHLVLVGIGNPPEWGVLLILWAIYGAAYSAIQTPSGRLLRRSAMPEDRAAVFTAHFALSHACWLITYPLAGWSFASFGQTTSLIILAATAALGLLLALRYWPAGTSDALAHSHPDLPADHPHLRAHGTQNHRHAIIIDDAHNHWPPMPRL